MKEYVCANFVKHWQFDIQSTANDLWDTQKLKMRREFLQSKRCERKTENSELHRPWIKGTEPLLKY